MLKFGQDSRFSSVQSRGAICVRRARIGHADAFLDKILRARSRFVQNLIGDILHHSAHPGCNSAEEISFDDRLDSRHRKSIVRGTASERASDKQSYFFGTRCMWPAGSTQTGWNPIGAAQPQSDLCTHEARFR